MELSIKPNSVPHQEACAICGRAIDVRIPYDIFPTYSGQPLCNHCAEKHAPELKQMLDQWFSTEVKDFTLSDTQALRKQLKDRLGSQAQH